MRSRERVFAALSHQQPDRTPYFEYVLCPPIASILIGHEMIEYASTEKKWISYANTVGFEKALKTYVSDRLDLAQKLGHDMLYVCPNPLPTDLKLNQDKESPSLFNGDPVEKVLARNKNLHEHSDQPEKDCFIVFSLFQEEMKRRDIDLPILAPAYKHGVWTDTDLMQTMILEPEIAGDHFTLATESAMALIHTYLEMGIDQIGIGGDFAGKRPIISPELYREFIVPEVKKCSQVIHKGNGWAINASDGDLWSVIDDFLLGCEVDGYLEIDMMAGMGMKNLKKQYGNKITFYGNMDCGNVLSFSEPEEIEEVTINILTQGAGDGGHIFCASNAITESVPMKNYLAMVNAYRKTFGLSQIK